MTIANGLAAELAQEIATTRRVLEAIPESTYSFQPHEKSMSMIALASHIAESIGWIDTAISQDVFEMDPAQYKPFIATSKPELLAELARNTGMAMGALEGSGDEHMMGIWTMKVGGQVALQMPRAAVVRVFGLSHMIHHRGQLSVYLRLSDVPIPQIYGPTADFPTMTP